MKVIQGMIFVYTYSVYIHAGCPCHSAKVPCMNFTTKIKKKAPLRTQIQKLHS
jgi:hypothetical protein